MIYIISVVVYVIVFLAGMYVVKKHPNRTEKIIFKLCLVGFVLQLMINYSFWGSLATELNPLASSVGTERSSINLMFYALISIFCYASLLVVLSKAKDFYER